MIAYKNMPKAVSIMMTVAVIICIGVTALSQKAVEVLGQSGITMQYPSELFDTDEIIRINIQMKEEEWEDMLANASAEEYYACDIVINGREIYHVGIRPKGNTSLSAIAMNPETDRFSLKLEFDHYVDGQDCFGLDKLILNNNYADATNMKEAVVYDMYQYLGADASLYNYAEISVNGEYWGIYLALEAVEDSFLLRNFGTGNGKLYKPDGQEQASGGHGPSFGNQAPGDLGDIREDGKRPEGEGFAPEREPGFLEGKEDGPSSIRDDRPPGMEGMGKGGPFMGGNGADLNYTDDDPDSYSAIWEGEVTDTGKKDHRRVVTALKKIDEGTDLEEYLDIDNVLRYMAVHTFSVNMDSLSGSMAHNYYLYEYNGKLNILPWDYNLSFGGMGMGAADGASGMINDAIDTPFHGTEFFDALLEDEEYLAKYHEYLRQLTEGYVFGGKFEETYGRIRNQIDALVKTDPTALYSYEEYEAGADMLYSTVMLRAESIQGQLDGAIPSTDEGQKEDNAYLVDASAIDIDAMGVFDMGGRGRRRDDQDSP